MLYTVYLTPSALADLFVAKDYYNSKSNGLGNKMGSEVEKTINTIAINPQTYSIRYRDIRAAKVPSFPYLIFYKIDELDKSIKVLRVFNTYQQPFWG